MRFRFTRSFMMRWAAGGLLLTTLVPGVLAPAVVVANPNCSLSLAGSNFEIEANANLKVDGTSPCIDWLTGGSGTQLRTGVSAKRDKATGTGDDSFGQGTSENDPVPTVVSGSIPPNKSDLKVFGVYSETGTPTDPNPSGKFLELFWARVQNPSGTTNMDFELNQSNVLSANGVTPIRTAGDKLISYDLSKGGTVPTISIRSWTGSVWSTASVISGGNNAAALGSVNTSAITANDAGTFVGSLDAFTFGEVSITFAAIFSGNGTCGSFGSAYLKSRSSDSFTAEIKDFIAPEAVNISNCTTLTTTATQSVVLGSPISDTAHLTGAGAGAVGTMTFHLFNNAACTTEVTTGLIPVTVSGSNDYNSGNFTPTAVGTYYWIANYSGDPASFTLPVSTSCGDANESSIVTKRPSTIQTAQTYTPQDTATVTGTGTFDGKVSFALFSSNNCSGQAVYTENNVSLSSNSSGATASTHNGTATTFVINSANDTTPYSWNVTYNGDSTHFDVVSCVENSTVTITNGGPVTTP